MSTNQQLEPEQRASTLSHSPRIPSGRVDVTALFSKKSQSSHLSKDISSRGIIPRYRGIETMNFDVDE